MSPPGSLWLASQRAAESTAIYGEKRTKLLAGGEAMIAPYLSNFVLVLETVLEKDKNLFTGEEVEILGTVLFVPFFKPSKIQNTLSK